MNKLRKAASFTAGVVIVVAAFWCGGYDFSRGFWGIMCFLGSILFGVWLAVLIELQGFVDATGVLCAQNDRQPCRKMHGKPTHWMPLPAAPSQPKGEK